MTNIEKLISDGERMRFIDIVTFDNDGYLWFTANKLHKYIQQTMDFSGIDGPNVYIWKIYVGEAGYLDQRQEYNFEYISRQLHSIISNLIRPFFKFD